MSLILLILLILALVFGGGGGFYYGLNRVIRWQRKLRWHSVLIVLVVISADGALRL